MQTLPAGAARARPTLAAAAVGRRIAIVARPATATSRRRRPQLSPPPRYNTGSGGNSNSSAPPTPTVALRLGSAADAATLTLPLPPHAARRLDAELRALHATLRAKQEAADAGERPRRWPAMEFAFPDPAGDEGDLGGGAPLALQLYCNPNAHGSAFDAKVFVRVECASGGDATGGNGSGGAVVRMTGEARLTDVQGTLEAYWEVLREQQEQQGHE